LSIETGQAGDRARLLVANSGERIDQAEVPLLFQRFYRRDPSRSRATGGAGLGLSIAEAVSRAHAGRIEATALSGGGLRIVTDLPLRAQPAEPSLPGPSKAGIKGLLTTPLSRVP
jgi:two-component system OmpR family sensor kinase